MKLTFQTIWNHVTGDIEPRITDLENRLADLEDQVNPPKGVEKRHWQFGNWEVLDDRHEEIPRTDSVAPGKTEPQCRLDL